VPRPRPHIARLLAATTMTALLLLSHWVEAPAHHRTPAPDAAVYGLAYAGTVPSPARASRAGAPPPAGGDRCGSGGQRFQAVYANVAGGSDQDQAERKKLLRYLRVVDDVLSASARETGGERYVRLVTDDACVPVIANVELAAPGDNFADIVHELRTRGFERTDRKYLVWVDAKGPCGYGTFESDDRPGQHNLNNRGPSYGVIWRDCWGGYIEAHELMHTLGAVQASAPNSNGEGHCNDEYDLMCYPQGVNRLRYACGDRHERRFDCRHDDYFSTAPEPGSYLDTHWNAADSAFLTD